MLEIQLGCVSIPSITHRTGKVEQNFLWHLSYNHSSTDLCYVSCQFIFSVHHSHLDCFFFNISLFLPLPKKLSSIISLIYTPWVLYRQGNSSDGLAGNDFNPPSTRRCWFGSCSPGPPSPWHFPAWNADSDLWFEHPGTQGSATEAPVKRVGSFFLIAAYGEELSNVALVPIWIQKKKTWLIYLVWTYSSVAFITKHPQIFQYFRSFQHRIPHEGASNLVIFAVNSEVFALEKNVSPCLTKA